MEIQFLGFVYEVFDEVAGQIARTRFRSGGTKPAPVTIVHLWWWRPHSRVAC